MDADYSIIGRCETATEAAILARLISTVPTKGVAAAVEEALASMNGCRAKAQRVRALLRVVGDLISHGWLLSVVGTELRGKCNGTRNGESRREYVRRVQLGQREQQLKKEAVRDFVRSMERRRLGKQGWTSIFSLMRDGRELAKALRSSCVYVPAVINPYIQVIENPDQRCEFTGLRLMDIWRYFRYTWAIPYNSVPGRSMLVLIRDAAAPNHPIMGIAALGSAIVQLSQRDAWIGWTGPEFLQRIEQQPSPRIARWIGTQLSELIGAIFKGDLLTEKVITPREIRTPAPSTVANLRRAAAAAWKLHRMYPSRKEHKLREYTTKHWRRQVLLPLFRAKRCETLARLLEVRRTLNRLNFSPTLEGLHRLVSQPSGKRAIEILVRGAKAQHIGIDILDITVCGAIPPYNPLLGGKLVAMLLSSPEIVSSYSKRYRNLPSVIASSMAGRTVRREPRLVLLGTTSLYGERLNQYHRVQIPAGVARNRSPVRFQYLGESEGFGSSHLGRATVEELELLLAHSSQGRRVNSIFGEGVSPRLRKVRDGLDLLGLDPDLILKHGNRRILYGIPLATNFRDFLVGLEDRPKYAISLRNKKQTTNDIARFWGERWLQTRICKRPEVLDAVAANDLRLPDSHAARVQLPESPTETLPLFA